MKHIFCEGRQAIDRLKNNYETMIHEVVKEGLIGEAVFDLKFKKV
jgi:hypothetical protein